VLALSGGSGEGDESDMDSSVSHERERGDEVDAGASGAREWIGTTTFIGPTGTNSFLDQFREARVQLAGIPYTAWLRCGYALPTGAEASELGWLEHAWNGREQT